MRITVRLIKSTSVLHGGNNLIIPVNNTHLFRHCSGEMIAVTEARWEDEVEPLLYAHGVSGVTVIDETGPAEGDEQ